MWEWEFLETEFESGWNFKNESWCVKIGNPRNHSKAEFIEIMNKMIMIMIIISSGINTGIGAWETEN